MHANEEDMCFHSVTYLFFSSLGADFVTGVPKGLMLYGLVSDPHALLAQNSTYRIVHVQKQELQEESLRCSHVPINSDVARLVVGVRVKWKGSEVSDQPHRGAGMSR